MESKQLPQLTAPRNFKAFELEEIKQAICTMDLRVAEDKEIAELVQRLIYGYGLFVPRLKPPVRLYRGRSCLKPKNISELIYPPVGKTLIGRANAAGDPVFYCSMDFHTPTFEASIALGDSYTLSTWETTVDMTINAIGYTRSAFEKLDSERVDCGWNFTHTDENRAEFLAQLFTERVPDDQRYRYRFTNALAKFMSADLFSGIMYPAIARHANGDNLALNRAYADSLKFIEVRFWILKEITVDARRRANGRKIFTELDSAREIAKDGAIKWLGPGALGAGEYTTIRS
jgi:hypothetical protein